MQMKAVRFKGNPVIHQSLHEEIGDNINGASLIRVPPWIKNPLARYYLYFAHHKGRYIRLAYANNIEGPWQIHKPGVLNVSETQFVKEDITSPIEATGSWAKATGGQFLYAHVASPDVHIDDKEQKILMYYHGLLEDGEQKTRLALSDDGLSFTSLEPLLGTPYFRAFPFQNYIYAFAWGGALFRARNWQGPFEQGPDVITASKMIPENQTIRHVAVRRIPSDIEGNNQLELFYSCIGDNPESIYRTVIQLSENWHNWKIEKPELLLCPELSWEGANLPAKPSKVGAAEGPENGLRDPCIFKDHLFYCGAGETAIGLAKLTE